LYGVLFRESISAGMLLMPCCFEFHSDHVAWKGFKPLKLN
jgi:sugar fermentation stimulation protein A